MARFSARILELVAKIDTLSDDAVLPLKVYEAMGGPSERTLRRNPPIPRIQLSPRCTGLRLGDWRKLVRNNSAA